MRRKRLWHESPDWVREDAIFFVTICCRERGQNQLCHPETGDRILESVRFRHTRGDWYVHLFLLMPDHAHVLVSFPDEKEMGHVVGQWKEFVAKSLAVKWQRDFFDHRLRKEESLREKAEYIEQNPVRNGLVAEAQYWPYVWYPEIVGQTAGRPQTHRQGKARPAVAPYHRT